VSSRTGKPARGSESGWRGVLGFRAVHAASKIFGDSLLSGLEDADAELVFSSGGEGDFRAVIDATEISRGRAKRR